MKGVNAKKPQQNKPKMTKEERKAKYTQLARQRSAKQRQRREQQNLVCFNCRQRGHGIENCPQVKQGSSSRSAVAITRCCYKCGSMEHSLGNCPKHKNNDMRDLPFAMCFVCQEKGHLAGHCPKNEKGIYVNGGACSVCKSKSHLSKDCPTSKKKNKKDDDKDGETIRGLPAMDNYDDLLDAGKSETVVNPEKDTGKTTDTSSNKTAPVSVKKRRVVKF
mmetsp:Transcript_11238/g.22998  ORF Transcript_11238/g.22998 Transcript_11238/m.22998 type:complete len:219 (-) Transcript_11238:1753-2409(-)